LTPWDTQQSRIFTEEGLSPTLAGADGGGGRNPAGLVYCSSSGQSDAAAKATAELAGTLTCVHEQPFIYEPKSKAAGFMGNASANARSIGYAEEVSPTLRGEPSPCVCKPSETNDAQSIGISADAASDNPTITVLNDQGGNSISVEKSELSPTLRSETHGNLPIVALPDTPAVTMRLREGCAGGGKGPLLQHEKCGTLAAGNDQYLFAPQAVKAYPISTQIATRHNALGEGMGFGIGDDGDPAYTLQQAHGHAVAVGGGSHTAGTGVHAVGVHQGIGGDVNISDTAYCLSTNGQASGRNAPLICENSNYSGSIINSDIAQSAQSCEKIKAFSLDSLNSNSMLSSNPLSGCREVETAQTLVTASPCPSKNQGGIAIVEGIAADKPAIDEEIATAEKSAVYEEIATENRLAAITDVHPKVVGTLTASASGMNRPGGMGSETDLCIAYCLQGNMIGRQDHNGPRGNGVNEETAFTLTATDVSGVAALFKRQRSDSFTESDIAGTQTACQCKGEMDLVCEHRASVTHPVSAVDCRNYKELGEISGTLCAKNAPGYSLNFQNPVRTPKPCTLRLYCPAASACGM